jgi:hypothetical protein
MPGNLTKLPTGASFGLIASDNSISRDFLTPKKSQTTKRLQTKTHTHAQMTNPKDRIRPCLASLPVGLSLVMPFADELLPCHE